MSEVTYSFENAMPLGKDMLARNFTTNIILDFVRLDPDCVIPTKAHPADACFDLYSTITTRIYPHTTVKIPLGFAAAIPTGFFAAIFARSGLGARGIRPGNCVGVIDSEYRGEWMVALHNDNDSEIYLVNKGDRIAQFTLLPVINVQLRENTRLDNTERESGGFGSTGK